MPPDSDEEFMRRFQSGDEQAFRLLFDRYASHLINFAYRMLTSRDEAEDLTQEVLLRVYRAKDHYDPSRPLRPWIFAIASRLISNRLRDRKLHSQVSLDFKPDEDHDAILASDLPDRASPPSDEILERQRLVQQVQKALAELPENQRTAVLLARFEEMPYEEIAVAMGNSVSSVKSLLFRARQTLKTILTAYVQEAR